MYYVAPITLYAACPQQTPTSHSEFQFCPLVHARNLSHSSALLFTQTHPSARPQVLSTKTTTSLFTTVAGAQ